ncbi:unnamed protein product [Clonostachys rhizophaga]|uniref:non-specific serine/threonine protein kinase n=1 Tax=Clonostachys rhizophaga TaxID=160324 RepID=A0A9N9V7B7_9HYPO|nr:unnamed protein product [Clonostachys rhizophaga]
MNGDLSLSQALGGLRIANPDDVAAQPSPLPSDTSQPTATAPATSSGPPPTTEPVALTTTTTTTAATSTATTDPNHRDSAARPAQHEEPGFLAVSSEPPSLPDFSRSSTYDLSPMIESTTTVSTAASTAPSYPSREPSQRDTQWSYNSSRQAAISSSNPPVRRSSRAMGGGHTQSQTGAHAPYAGDAPIPSTSEEWQERGAAVGVRRETDASGRTVVRQVKKGVRDFSFGRILGEGSYSSVYLATDRQTLKEYAIKVLEKRHIIKEKKIKYVNIEKDTLNRLTEHPGIVRLYYTFQDQNSLYYVLDLCSGGELLGVLKKTGTFDVECTRFYSAQILDAISYMHSRGVIHRDLKPENVLLDDQMNIKITDFGTAKLLQDPREARRQMERGILDPSRGDEDDDGRAASFVGTAEYVSPELLTHKNACKASDLWAFGCIVYQLLVGRPPFKAGSEYLTFQKIVHLEYEFPQGFPLAARDLVERLLVLDPSRRLTIEHIKNHEFFDGQAFGKTLWRTKAPRLRPYVPTVPEPTVIQLNGGHSAVPPPISQSRSAPSNQANMANGAGRPARLITELPPPTQLDIEWSPVLTKNNERILRLGDLLVVSTPLPNGSNGKGSEDGHKKLSRFFGGSTTKKRQRLVMITSSGRVLLAPAGGEEKRAKTELSLLASDCTWKTQTDAKGQLVWCVDTGGYHYTFEDTKNSSQIDTSRPSAEEWVECLERAKDLAVAQSMNSYGEGGLADLSSTMSSPSSTIGGGRANNSHEMIGATDRSSRSHVSKGQGNMDEVSPAPKRNRFSKRQSRNGLDSAF